VSPNPPGTEITGNYQGLLPELERLHYDSEMIGSPNRYFLLQRMVLLSVWISSGLAQTVSTKAYDLVNPIIGSSGEGMTSPTAQVPFGMVQWGPDTHVGEWYNYAFEDNKILGFSMTHLSGAGCRLFNDLPVLPWIGDIEASPGAAGVYSLAFSHSKEDAHPGYYAVTTDSGIKTELTAALRSGIARFTFPAGATRTLLLEAGSSATADMSSAKSDISSIQLSGDSASGKLTSGHFCNSGPTYTLYYTMQFSQPFASTGGWDANVHPGAISATGHKAGAWVTFAPSEKPVLMKVGLSYVSVENAKANLQADLPEMPRSGFDKQFEVTRQAAERIWSEALGKIDVTGGTHDQRSIFYTGLYHMLLSPNVFSDHNGEYVDFDGKARQLQPGEEQYTNFSDWDTAHNVMQLQSVLFPKQSSQMMQSLVRDAEQNGIFPRWAYANGVSWVMSGDSPAVLLSDAYAFGARDFDAKTALKYMVQAATVPENWWHGGKERLDLEEYLSKGYVSLRDHKYPSMYAASASLNFNNADFAVSRMAEALGDHTDAQLLLKHAQYWRNLFDRDSGLIRPREQDGSFVAGWDPEHYLPRFDRLSALGFEEGSAYQYTYMLPFNYAGLIQALGGREAAIPKFDKFFEKVVGWNTINFTTTNEPDFGEEYIYDWLGQPWKTQAVISRELGTFTGKPDGLPGNDDLGATSGLDVFDSLGFYPVIPGVGGFALGAPVFPKAHIALGDGRTFDIERHGKGIYVQRLAVNGQSYRSTWLPLDRLSKTHNVMTVWMGEQPNKSWGAATKDVPPSFDVP
jgi:predicted alpha-1,2-mannosidase